MIVYNKKTPFQAIKTRISKSQKIDIFLKGLTHRFAPKMPIFPTFFSKAIQARIIFFMIFWNEKTPFQTIKTKSSKSRKIDIISNGLTHGFGPKIVIFPTFVFAIQAKKMSFMIFQNERTPFQAVKKRSSKSPKMAIFPTFFQAIYASKMCFTIFQIEKTAFLSYKNQELKKSTN